MAHNDRSDARDAVLAGSSVSALCGTFRVSSACNWPMVSGKAVERRTKRLIRQLRAESHNVVREKPD